MGSRGSHNAGDQQKQPLHFSLENILNEDGDQAEYDIPKEKAEQGWDEEGRDREAAVGYCIECEGTYTRLVCLIGLLNPSSHRSACPTSLREL